MNDEVHQIPSAVVRIGDRVVQREAEHHHRSIKRTIRGNWLCEQTECIRPQRSLLREHVGTMQIRQIVAMPETSKAGCIDDGDGNAHEDGYTQGPRLQDGQ